MEAYTYEDIAITNGIYWTKGGGGKRILLPE